MKDNSPLFHTTLLFVFVAFVGWLSVFSGSPKTGLKRPGTQAPAPFVVPVKSVPAPESVKSPESTPETPASGAVEQAAPSAADEGTWN